MLSSQYSKLFKEFEELKIKIDILEKEFKDLNSKNEKIVDFTSSEKDVIRIKLLNTASFKILRSGRKKEYQRIGVKSVKLQLLKRTNHYALFDKKSLRIEIKMVERIIEVRNQYGNFKLK